MNEQISGRMKRMTRLYGWLIPVFVLYSISLSFLLAGVGMKLLGNSEPEETPVAFNVYNGADIYSSLDSQMMTLEFASDFKETNHYYFVYDAELLPYIIQVHGDLPEESLKIQAYLYDESDEAPEPVTFYGMSAPIEEDIRKYAMESYNEMWGEELVTEDNFSDYFGEYYLDTTRKPSSRTSDNLYFFLYSAFLLAALGTLLLVSSLKGQRFKRGLATRKAWPEEKLLVLDRQLNAAATMAYEKEQLYLTDDYILTNAEGFEIIPYGAVVRVFDTVSGANKRLMVQTSDQAYHTLALAKGIGSGKHEAFQELVNQVKKKIAGKQEELAVTIPVPEHEWNTEAGEGVIPAAAYREEEKGSLLPGIVGALLGSLVGAGLWVLIGQIGFIAGIAGFVMLKLALSGYQKLGKGLDKKGAVICLIITAGMILGANFLDYAVSMARAYFQYEASFETLFYVFSSFGSLMSEMDMWQGFFLDLAIGYGLSVWSCAGAIKAIVKM
ncbi:hypothetical protein AALB39_01845 [Lachnospiraceae bacterium 54-53]